jgi:hypothetical protein
MSAVFLLVREQQFERELRVREEPRQADETTERILPTTPPRRTARRQDLPGR